jgi:lactobin A/cerein 7B family class IIb bacteriocin
MNKISLEVRDELSDQDLDTVNGGNAVAIAIVAVAAAVIITYEVYQYYHNKK